MNRTLHLLLGPEVVMGLLTLIVFVFCRRHSSYSRHDVELLERCMWLLPVVAVLLAYSTILVPGAKSWLWLGRANVALLVAVMTCAMRIVDGFGAPGSGPKGQDVGLLVVLSLSVVFGSLANSITGALILEAQSPKFAGWLQAHRFIGWTLTVLSAVPLGLALGLIVSLALGLVLALISAFQR